MIKLPVDLNDVIEADTNLDIRRVVNGWIYEYWELSSEGRKNYLVQCVFVPDTRK